MTSLDQWYKKWQAKVNAVKSAHVTFTMRRGNCQGIYINGLQIPQADSRKYRKFYLDRRLTWKTHIPANRRHLDMWMGKFYWILEILKLFENIFHLFAKFSRPSVLLARANTELIIPSWSLPNTRRKSYWLQTLILGDRWYEFISINGATSG